MINLAALSVPPKIKAHIDDRFESARLESRLKDAFRNAHPRPVLVLCIGTDRSTGDSLGPLTGTHLSRLNLPRLEVWGNLDQPVHAANLGERLNHIYENIQNPFILAVDACLGRQDAIGCLTLAPGPLKPGAGVHKELPAVGEFHLTGIVNIGGFMEYMVLQNTRL
ncbi:MAG: spore protease YyaC, partial [Peptococcaceae bacterium]|nr:spore protease YyaC [Peptococcaceae bacterium]